MNIKSKILRWPFVMLTAVWNNNNISFCQLINIRTAKCNAITSKTTTQTNTTLYRWQLMRRSVTIVASFIWYVVSASSINFICSRVSFFMAYFSSYDSQNGFIILPIEQYSQIFPKIGSSRTQWDVRQFIKFLFFFLRFRQICHKFWI